MAKSTSKSDTEYNTPRQQAPAKIIYKILFWIAKRYRHNNLSPWKVLCVDMLLVVMSFGIAQLFFQHFLNNANNTANSLIRLAELMTISLASFAITGSYRGIMRHSGMNDVLKIVFACSIGAILSLTLSFINRTYHIAPVNCFILYTEAVICYAMLAVLMIYFRLLCHYIYNNYIRKRRAQNNVIIYGAGVAGMLAANALRNEQRQDYNICAFIDDDKNKTKHQLNGIHIYSRHEALTPEFVTRNKINTLLIAIPSMRPSAKQDIINQGLDLDLSVKTIPHVNSWINGSFASSQIQDIKIEDLLERDPIQLDNTNVHNELSGKTVLVTGAAGSIGSEICRQVLCHNPKCVVMLDQAESAMYDLQFELCNTPKFKEIKERMIFVIANVKDERRIQQTFTTYKPDIVYHAAAYKHVPFMEENAYEACYANIYGTKVVADCALQHRVKKFVMISTDKAVNPTNVMGATKRMAEIYVQSHSNDDTHFITTRFGNVLGSNGSVIPLFKKQLAAGGPLTVTHRDIIRYFMTIPEACSLVLEASAIGNGGDIFVFDMGEPVKIYQLAKRMIQLSGLKDIKIVETGLRPGEKLYEELLADREQNLPTDNPKIMRAQVRQYQKEAVDTAYSQFLATLQSLDDATIVAEMKKIVPEFISNNSVFCQLDNNKK